LTAIEWCFAVEVFWSLRMATMSFQWWERRYVHIMSVYSEFVSASALIVHCNAFSWFLDIDPAGDQSSPGFSLTATATAFSQRRSGAHHDAGSQGSLGHVIVDHT
jgi:hypothetical protein